MKKVLKFIMFILLAIVSIFTVASCSEEPSNSEPSKETSESSSSSSSVGSESSSSSSTLTETEIKANFDAKVEGITLSKAVINSAIDKVVDKVLDENSIDLDSINLPNSKASVTLYGGETPTTTDSYLWQNERVVYTTYAGQTYKVDLDEVKTILDTLSTQASETTDYVGLLLNYVQLPEGFDLDATLANVKLTGEDFTYDSTTGYFILKTDAIYRIVSQVSGKDQLVVQTAVATYVSDLVVKIGYDGVHFTGLVFEVRPSDVLCVQGFDATKSYLTLNVGLTYNGNKVATATVAFNYVFTPLATSTIEKQEVSLNATYNGTTLSGTAKVNYGMLDLRSRIEMESTFTLTKTTATVTLTGSYKGVQCSSNPESTEVTYSWAPAQTFSATLNVTESSLTGSVKFDNKEVVNLEGTVANNEVTTLTVTLKHTDETNSTFATAVLTIVDVTIPDTVKTTEADATDLIEMIKGLIGGGSQDTPETPEQSA